ncbi:MAG: hypothetical protein OFPI_27440 [Osedax symbiont Rs2]|nr:MAG: hypothetical protein OFPI_27440 [Osedax symbiont Rs2]
MPAELRSIFIICFFSAFVAFLVVPLYMIGNSPDDFNFISRKIFFSTSILLSVFLGGGLSFIGTGLYVLKFKKTALLFSYFVLIWILVSGLFLSVSASTGMVDPENNPVDLLNAFCVLVVTLLLTLICLTNFKKYIEIFVGVVVVSVLVPAIVSFYNADFVTANIKNHQSTSISGKRNIFVISFDGMPGSIISNVIKSNKYYAEELKDFTFFDNAVSQSPSTSASLFGEIYGIHDYKSIGKTRDSVLNELGYKNKELYTFTLDSYQHGYPGFEIKPMKIYNPDSEIQNKNSTFDVFKYTFVRIWTHIGLKLINWDVSTRTIKRYIVGTGIDSFSVLIDKMANHNGASWDKKNILTLKLFDSFVSNLSLGNNDFSVRYLHFTFTHFPVDYDSECEYKSDDLVWYEENQNKQGIMGQGKCAIGKFLSFVHKIKTLGVYNDSLIIFKSDHGKPVSYYSAKPQNTMINDNPNWGYDRYRPTLMIKGFGIDNSKIAFKSDLVLISDIAMTLCKASELDVECENTPGVDLLGDSLDNGKPYYIYVPKDSKSSFLYSEHVSVKIMSRQTPLLDAMSRSEHIELSNPN